MPGPSQFQKLRGEGQNPRVQDNIDATLEPIARALNSTPIMGSPPPPWIKPDLAAGWSNIGGQFATAGYHKDALGYVHVKGVLTNSSGGIMVAASTIWTMPMGYRPGATQRFSVPGAAVTAQEVTITAAGVIMNNAAVANGAAMDVVFTYLAEQ